MTGIEAGAEPGAEADSHPTDLERVRRVYRRFAPFYDVFRGFWGLLTWPIDSHLDRLFRDRIRPAASVLELGPGTGINLTRLLRCAPRFGSYLGIDASDAMLRRARARAAGDNRVTLQVGDATKLAEVGTALDFIVSTWLLSHLEEPVETVRDALGHLAPGGAAVFVFTSPSRWRIVNWLLHRLSGPFSFEPIDPEPICALPEVEHVQRSAAGLATLVVLRAPQSSPNAAEAQSSGSLEGT